MGLTHQHHHISPPPSTLKKSYPLLFSENRHIIASPTLPPFFDCNHQISMGNSLTNSKDQIATTPTQPQTGNGLPGGTDSQVSIMMTQLSLMPDLLTLILQYCPLETLQHLIYTSSIFYNILRDDAYFWRVYLGGDCVVDLVENGAYNSELVSSVGEGGVDAATRTTVTQQQTAASSNLRNTTTIDSIQKFSSFLSMQKMFHSDIARVKHMPLPNAHSEAVNHVYASRNGMVISTSFDHNIKVWKDRGERLLQTISFHKAPIITARWSRQHIIGDEASHAADEDVSTSSSEFFISLDWNSVVARHAWSQVDQRFTKPTQLQLGGELKSAGMLFNGGRHIICATNDPALYQVDLNQMKCVSKFQKHHSSNIAWVEQVDSNLFSTCGRDRTVCLFDTRQQTPVKQLTSFPCGVYKMTHHTPSKRIYVGGYNGCIWCIDPRTMTTRYKMEGHNGRISFLKMNRKGILLSGSKDLTVRLWKTTDTHGFKENILSPFRGFPQDAIFDDYKVAVCSYDSKLTIFHNGFASPYTSNGMPLKIQSVLMGDNNLAQLHSVRFKQYDCALSLASVRHSVSHEDIYVGVADGSIQRYTFGGDAGVEA